MVFAIILISNEGQLLFSNFFTSNGNDFLKSERQQFITRQILDEFEFRKNCRETAFLRSETNSLDWSLLSSENKGKNEEGVFRLARSEKSPLLTIVWKQIGSVIYSLACEEEENIVLASQFLNLFPKILDEQYKKPGICANPKEFLSKPEEFLVLLHFFLPNGQLLFILTQFGKQLRKDAETILLSK